MSRQGMYLAIGNQTSVGHMPGFFSSLHLTHCSWCEDVIRETYDCALVVKWISCRSPEPEVWVQFPARANCPFAILPLETDLYRFSLIQTCIGCGISPSETPSFPVLTPLTR